MLQGPVAWGRLEAEGEERSVSRCLHCFLLIDGPGAAWSVETTEPPLHRPRQRTMATATRVATAETMNRDTPEAAE